MALINAATNFLVMFRRFHFLRMRLVQLLIALLAFGIVGTQIVQAAVLLSNTAGSVAGSASLGLPRAVEIVVPAGSAYTLDSFTARLFVVTSPATVQFDLYTDSSGSPGSLVANIGTNNFSSTGFETFTPSSLILLEAGHTYWIVGRQTSGAVQWSATSTAPASGAGFTSLHQLYYSGGVWGNDDGFGYNMFSLDGSAAPATTVSSINRVTTSPTNATSVSWTVTFADAISGLTSSNFTLAPSGVSGASLSSVTASGTAPTTTWVVAANTGSGNGMLGLNMTSTAGLDHAVSNLPFTGQTYTIDKTPPSVVSVTRANANPTTGGTLNWTATLSEPINPLSLSAADFTINTSGTTYTSVNVNYTNGTTTITIIVGGVSGSGTIRADFTGTLSDLAGNTISTPVTGETYTVDSTAPTVTINQASGQSDPTNASPINFDVVFSESVTGFDNSDIDFTGSTVGGTLAAAVSGSGPTYSVSVTGMTSDGMVVASIPANAAQDTLGNNSAASTSSDNSVTYDATPPTVTINQASGQSDPTNTSPINFDVTFNKPVSGFDGSDIDFTGSTVSGTLVAVVSGSGTTYSISVTGMTSDGLVVASIPANAAQDAAGNDSDASTSTDNSVTYDATKPGVTIMSTASDPTNASPIPIQITFDSDVSGFDDTDPVITNGTLSNFTAIDAAHYTFDVTPAALGTVAVDVPADAAVDASSNGNVADNFSIVYAASATGIKEVTILNDGSDVALTIPNPGSGTPTFSIVSGADPRLTLNSTTGAFLYDFENEAATGTYTVTVQIDVDAQVFSYMVIIHVTQAPPPPPPSPTCNDENFDENGVIRTGIANDIAYAINCRVLYQNGASTTWLGSALYSEANLGVAGLLDLGVEQAVDIFSPVGMTYFEGGEVFCLRGQGTLIWQAASGIPRHAEIIGSYTVPEFPGFTCATLFEPGTFILVSQNPLDR